LIPPATMQIKKNLIEKTSGARYIWRP
jgi:hypothetical protein